MLQDLFKTPGINLPRRIVVIDPQTLLPFAFTDMDRRVIAWVNYCSSYLCTPDTYCTGFAVAVDESHRIKIFDLLNQEKQKLAALTKRDRLSANFKDSYLRKAIIRFQNNREAIALTWTNPENYNAEPSVGWKACTMMRGGPHATENEASNKNCCLIGWSVATSDYAFSRVIDRTLVVWRDGRWFVDATVEDGFRKALQKYLDKHQVQ